MTTLILSIPSPARFVVAALSVGPLLFSSPDYAQIKTPPANDAAVITSCRVVLPTRSTIKQSSLPQRPCASATIC